MRRLEVGGQKFSTCAREMGKMKRCSRARRERCRPTGLPSVKETGRGEENVPEVTLPLLEKLSSVEVAERSWACRSIASLLCEANLQETLLNHQGLPRSLIPLLLDCEWSVREAAAGALRNLSSAGGDTICQTLVTNDIMTGLSALLKQCATQVQSYPVATEKVAKSLPTPPSPVPPPHPHPSSPSSGRQGKGKGKTSSDINLHHVLATVEQSLHLLLNISEGCSAVVELANREELVPVLLFFLQPSLFFPDILTTAAMCLYTVTEDNPPSHHLLTSTPSHLAQLETLLTPPPTGLLDQRHMMILSTATAGVFQHLLPSLPSPPPSHLVSSVFSVLASVLDTHVPSLLTTLTSTPPHTPPQGGCETEHSPEDRLDSVQLEEADSVFTAQLLALEILANFCYTEGGEGEWEDVEEEEVIGGETESEEAPMELESQQNVPEWLAGVLVEMGIVERVWRKCCLPLISSPSSETLSPQLSSIAARWQEVQTRAMAALQNMLSSLPPSFTSPDSALAMWRRVLEMVGSPGGVATCEEVTGLLVVLVGMMGDKEMQCVSVEQLEVLSTVCQERLASQQYQQVADIILIMASVGRHSLHFPLPLKTSLLEVVGRVVRDCVSSGGSVWVVARALDTLYDLFGADECPVSIFTHLQIMPILKRIAAQLPEKAASISKKDLGALYGEVVSARDNLQPFIDYMTTRTS